MDPFEIPSLRLVPMWTRLPSCTRSWMAKPSGIATRTTMRPKRSANFRSAAPTPGRGAELEIDAASMAGVRGAGRRAAPASRCRYRLLGGGLRLDHLGEGQGPVLDRVE